MLKFRVIAAGYIINLIKCNVKNVSLFTSRFSSGLILLEYIEDFKR